MDRFGIRIRPMAPEEWGFTDVTAYVGWLLVSGPSNVACNRDDDEGSLWSVHDAAHSNSAGLASRDLRLYTRRGFPFKADVFYFFKRGAETLQCEVRHAHDGDGYEIVISEAGKPDRIERHATSEQVHRRWLELHDGLQREGWWGPATQDGRG